MDWSNEEYVRVYTRETADDLDLSWEALALWRAMLIKFDRSGLLPARNGWLSVSRLTRIPIEVVERAGAELLKDGRVKATKGGYMAPNYVEAQTASKSDKLRQKESRDRRRANAESQIIESVDAGHDVSHAVTPSHEPSQNVTLCSADPLLTDASLPAAPEQRAFEAFTQKVDSAVKDRERKPRDEKPKTKLPDGWEPERSEANQQAERTARARGVNLEVELQKLRDWALAGNEKKSDWDATWRNWTRNAKASSNQPALTTQPRRIKEIR